MKQFLRLALLLLFLPASADARDNILVLIGDDMGVDQVGVYSDDLAYGHPGEGASPAPTPNLDALAAEGVLFRNAYTNPVCAPTRAQMLTGRHGFRTEIGVPEGAVLDHAETTVPELLGELYANAALGKWHLGSGMDRDHPVDAGFSYFAGGLGGGVGDYESWSKTTASESMAGTTQDNFSTYATSDAVDEALAKISEFGEDQWFVWVAFNAPHTPFHVPPSSLTTIDVSQTSNVTTKYKAAVEAMDTEIGRLLAGIPEAVLEDTTIIFVGDNGTTSRAVELPFDSTRAKGSLYEGGINVPFIVASPFVDESDRGTESSALVATIDLMATVAEIAGIESSGEDSHSFLPYLRDPTAATQAARPYIYNERFTPNGPGPYTDEERSLRGERYKVIWRNGIYEEMFDLENDPFEIDNLLPVEDLSEQELDVYNELLAAMDEIRNPSEELACAQPVTSGETPQASDCLFILRAAVGLETCDDPCVCDANGDESIAASDALLCLRKAVGQSVELECVCAADALSALIKN